MGRPSRPKFGRRGHVNIGSSGCGGVGVAVVTAVDPLNDVDDVTALASPPLAVLLLVTLCNVGLVTDVG